MSLVSNLFLLFVLASVLVYYIVPHKWQWLALLVFSYIYYIAGGLRFVVFILFSTIVTWLAALMIEKVETKGNHKAARKILIFGLILNFGMLGGVKYTNFCNRKSERTVSYEFKEVWRSFFLLEYHSILFSHPAIFWMSTGNAAKLRNIL